MRVAVVGGGISGLGAAYALKDSHEVTLFEKETRIGGHAHTVDVDYNGARIPVDTGFIVFNGHNYKHFTALLDHLRVATYASDMSFAVSDPSGFEWSTNGLGGMFAWKRNLARPGFLAMLGDILRFSTRARADLAANRNIEGRSLAQYVESLNLSRGFMCDYLLPMGAAIWSTPEHEMMRYPAASFLKFFDNHRLLHASRPEWRTVAGGSRTYVQAVRGALGARISSGAGVMEVQRAPEGVNVLIAGHGWQSFDQVIFACHSDETLAILGSGSTPAERAALQAIRYLPNTAYLHRDESLMPRRRAAWASWNYMRGRGGPDSVCLTYWMNLLQNIDQAYPLFVTLNPTTPPAAELTFGQFDYAHPQFNAEAMAAQKEIQALQGENRTRFAGAWLGYGFHEDGLASGLAAAKGLGARLPWEVSVSPVDPVSAARAAA
jgi:uncharacterized protein